MHHINQKEIEGEHFEAPHARTIKHLAAPWTFGTRNIWLGISIVQPGNSSNLHSHDCMEEVFYVVAGHGRICIDDEEEAIEPGSCVYIPTGASHQLINDSNANLEVLAVSSPPFSLESFKNVHNARLRISRKDNGGTMFCRPENTKKLASSAAERANLKAT